MPVVLLFIKSKDGSSYCLLISKLAPEKARNAAQARLNRFAIAGRENQFLRYRPNNA